MRISTFTIHNGQMVIRKQEEPKQDQADNLDELITVSFTSQGEEMRNTTGDEEGEEQPDEEEAEPLDKQVTAPVTRWITVGGKRIPISPPTGRRRPGERAEPQRVQIQAQLAAPVDFDRSISASRYGVTLTDYSVDEYAKMKCYLVPGLDAGFAIKPDGELVSLHNNSTQRGIGEQLVELSKQAGGTHFDHFDIPRLNEIYNAAGFVETERLKFDPQYAPEGWDYEKYDSPDVVFRQLVQSEEEAA